MSSMASSVLTIHNSIGTSYALAPTSQGQRWVGADIYQGKLWIDGYLFVNAGKMVWHERPGFHPVLEFDGLVARASMGGGSKFTPRTYPQLLFSCSVPLWWVFALSAVIFVICVVVRKRNSASMNGYCKECGYDLRATPNRCPECGTIPQSQRATLM
jgi:hypothetical protein